MKSAILLLHAVFLVIIHVVVARSWTVPLQSLSQGRISDDTRWRLPSTCPLNKRVSRHDVPLTDWLGDSDYQWYSTISVGTPPQNLTVLWDTGFSDLIIPQKNCTTCGIHRSFNPANSSSFSEARDGQLPLPFFTSENSTPLAAPEYAHCNLVYDQVAIGNLSQSHQGIILCNDYTPSLAEMPVDGIIGLAPHGVSYTGETSFFWNLWETNQLKYPVFSLYLPAGEAHGAQITLGDVDQTKYVGDITNLGLDPDHFQEWATWVHHFTAIHVDGQQLPRSISGNNTVRQAPFAGAAAILDSGTAFIQVPDYDTARDLYDSISGAIQPIDPAGAANNVYINVTLPASAFNLGEYPGQPGVCQAVFTHNRYNNSVGPYWILGSPLLQAYYTVWDGLSLQVGWAELTQDTSGFGFAGP
ncbi:acid protease [Xylariaceae sp. FL1651]|nr:acid protease [Xylariaceae sp. FL1651]